MSAKGYVALAVFFAGCAAILPLTLVAGIMLKGLVSIIMGAAAVFCILEAVFWGIDPAAIFTDIEDIDDRE